MKKQLDFLRGRLLLVLFLASVLGACGGGGGAGAQQVPSPTVPVPVPMPAPPSELRILILGQSISSNCNEYVYGPVANVFQVDRNGELKEAKDPFDWADCSKGSMWMPLGRKLIEAGVVKKVVFMPIGVDSSRVRDWQEGGAAFSKLSSVISLAKQKGLAFDFAFWHQGSADIGMTRDEYLTRLSSVVSYVNSNMTIGSWIIAVHSKCFGRYDENIEAAQRFYGDVPAERRFLGANTNSLGNEYRFDACHLNQKGQEEMASLWLASIQNALKR